MNNIPFNIYPILLSIHWLMDIWAVLIICHRKTMVWRLVHKYLFKFLFVFLLNPPSFRTFSLIFPQLTASHISLLFSSATALNTMLCELISQISLSILIFSYSDWSLALNTHSYEIHIYVPAWSINLQLTFNCLPEIFTCLFNRHL